MRVLPASITLNAIDCPILGSMSVYILLQLLATDESEHAVVLRVRVLAIRRCLIVFAPPAHVV